MVLHRKSNPTQIAEFVVDFGAPFTYPPPPPPPPPRVPPSKATAHEHMVPIGPLVPLLEIKQHGAGGLL